MLKKVNRDHQSESAERGHTEVILHVCILFIYLLSKEDFTVTLQPFRHMILQLEEGGLWGYHAINVKTTPDTL